MFGKLTNQAGEQKAENKTEPRDIPSSGEQKAENQTTPKDTIKQTEKGKTDDGSDRNSEQSTPQCSQKSSHQVIHPTTPQMQLMSTPLIQSTFDIGFVSENQSIACVGPGLAWVKINFRRLQLMDQHGAVKDTIDTEFDLIDAVISPQGELLLSDYTNNCIKSISPDKVVKTLFSTWWKPWGLCCLHSGDIVVTFIIEGRVAIYSMSGNIIQELDKKLFRNPYRVAQNKVNNDLFISDYDGKKVVALDASYYRVLYEYTGQGGTAFRPVELCNDSAGRILITDIDGHSVHILDKDGKFLQYLLSTVTECTL